MIVEYKSHLDVRFAEPHKKKKWMVLVVFCFSVDGEEYEIPVGFWTDFASVPRLLWTIISPYDLGWGPLPHDFGYFTGVKTKAYWDEVFNICMEIDKIAAWKRHSAYQAVSLFGGLTYSGYRKSNQKNLLVQPKSCPVLPSWRRGYAGAIR